MEQASLADLCSLVTDGTHDSPQLLTNGVPFIKGKHISSGRIDFDGCDFISHSDHLKVIERSKPERGDTLFSNIGSVGDAAFVDTDREFSIKNVALFKPNPKRVHPRYLFYLLKSPVTQGQLLARRSGSAQPFVGLNTLRSFVVTYHVRLADQERIAAILGAYDDLIEVNRRRIAVLEEMARRLFEEWFVHFRFPGHATHKMVETAQGPLPEGWNWTSLGELCAEVRSSVMPSEVAAGTRYVGLEHIPRRSTTLDAFGAIDAVTSLKLRFKRHDVLFGKIRPYFHKVAVAPWDGAASSDAIIIRARQEAWRGLVLSIVSSDAFVAHSVQTSNGTKMPRANWDLLTRYRVALPPSDILERFDGFIMNAVEASMVHAAANDRLTASRDLLLPRLISGELSVSDAEELLQAAD